MAADDNWLRYQRMSKDTAISLLMALKATVNELKAIAPHLPAQAPLHLLPLEPEEQPEPAANARDNQI